jgi:hypothetical protein
MDLRKQWKCEWTQNRLQEQVFEETLVNLSVPCK